MPRIRLVVTGKVEEVALAPALRQLFPEVELQTVKKDATTTNRLERPAGTARSDFLRLVDEMLAAGDVERVPGGEPFDHVVVVDDLELANADQAEIVVEHMSFAAEARLAELAAGSAVPAFPRGRNKQWKFLGDDAGRRRYLRERCSFHLLSPMVESLFFGESNGATWPALVRAGAGRAPIFDPAVTDIEHFITNDVDYLGVAETAGWTAGQAADPAWRARHPKHYVSFLCDPTGRRFRPYKEKEGGKAALEALAWPSVVGPPEHACMVRALLDDVADMAGVELPWLAQGAQHPLTRRRPGGVLPNIASRPCGGEIDGTAARRKK